MLWRSSATNDQLFLRRIRDELVDLGEAVADLRQRLQAARDIVTQLVADSSQARNAVQTLNQQVAALEARVAALEPLEP